MELHEWFQRMEEYFEYVRFQNEHDKALTASLHLTEELEFEEKWNYKERKTLELEYYDDIEEEALELEDDKYKYKDVDEEQDEEPNEKLKEEEKYDLLMEELEANTKGEEYNVEENEIEKALDTKEYDNILVKDRQEEKEDQQEETIEDQTYKPMEDDQEYGHAQVRIRKTNNMEIEEEAKIQGVAEVIEISRDKINIDEHFQYSSTVMTTIGHVNIKALVQRDGHGEFRYHQLGLIHFKVLYDVKAQQGEMKILPNCANSRYKDDVSYDMLREILMFPYGEIKLEDKVRDKTPALSINGFVVGNFTNGQNMIEYKEGSLNLKNMHKNTEGKGIYFLNIPFENFIDYMNLYPTKATNCIIWTWLNHQETSEFARYFSLKSHCFML
eukprot:Gb_34252 [translate_table: standard]